MACVWIHKKLKIVEIKVLKISVKNQTFRDLSFFSFEYLRCSIKRYLRVRPFSPDENDRRRNIKAR